MHGCFFRIGGLIAIVSGFFVLICLFISWKINTGHRLLDFFEDFAIDFRNSEEWVEVTFACLIIACLGIVLFSYSQTYGHACEEARAYASLIVEDKDSEEDIVVKIDGVEYVEHVSDAKLETNKRHYVYWHDRCEMLAKRKGL